MESLLLEVLSGLAIYIGARKPAESLRANQETGLFVWTE